MRICLFEDAHVVDLEPIALSRPAFDLQCGMTTLAEKQRRFVPLEDAGVLIRPHLADLFRLKNPNIVCNDVDWLSENVTLLVNARWLPPARPSSLDPEQLAADGPCLAVVGDEIAYALLSPDELESVKLDRLTEHLERCRQTLPNRPAGGALLRYLWEVVDANAEQIAVDFQMTRTAESNGRPDTMTLVGPSDWLRIDPTARIDPFVVADTSNGPIVIERDAVINSFTRIEGPCWIGPRTHLLGAQIRGGVSIGANCRVGGEVESSIIQAHTNKYHDGFLGHSYLGEWVNLGAGTHTSDLRNDYGDVKLMVDGRLVTTGRTKVGSYLGDHTKTGLGSLLNTGSNVGVFGQLLPSGELLPRFVPSFSAVEYSQLVERTDFDAAFETARRVTELRGEEFGAVHELLYRRIAAMTLSLRQRTVQESRRRTLRRGA